MQLQPIRPPGRVDRKAAEYASEIERLRSDGYTYEAIREALAAVGVAVSVGTLQREMRRLNRRPRSPFQSQAEASRGVPYSAPKTAVPVTEQPTLNSPSSRDIAEAFFHAHPSNPLLRTKETP